MKYNILATGSGGNAVIIEDYLMVDCGVSFKMLTPYYQDLKIILLTHIHGDHFCKSTIKRLAFERPTIRWMCGEWLVKALVDLGVEKKQIDVINDITNYSYENELYIKCFYLEHDVENLGYKIHFGETKVLYATDTNSLENVDAKNYDYYFLEANHTTEEIDRRIKEKKEAGKYSYESRAKENHLCKEKTDEFLLKNASDYSQFIYLHGHKDKIREEETNE